MHVTKPLRAPASACMIHVILMPQVDEALANVVSWLHKGSKMGCEVASLIQRTAYTIEDMHRELQGLHLELRQRDMLAGAENL